MKVTNIFGTGRSVLISDVQCNGIEENISQCSFNGLDSCIKSSQTGVICTKEFGKCIYYCSSE